MPELPSGTVTLLFTDVEGSTRLLQELRAERYAETLAEHRRLIRQACADEDGVEVDTQGDAFFIAFSDADRAARTAQTITESLREGPMRVRIGLHTGRPLLVGAGYVGDDVHLGARIAAAGHGGQVLMSDATRGAISEGVTVTELGEHRLKDIGRAVAIYQLGGAAFPPLKTISNTNLPRFADSFVGRDQELGDIVERVRSGSRLLTLVGPGGTGKTRLAIEAATSVLTDFKAGAFWVDLSSIRDPVAVSGAVAATLTTEHDVEAHIGEREMLLVLDNFEQVIGAGPWVGSLVTACPNLSVVVTSRERLRVRGESILEVPPLGVADASQLFADRAGIPSSAEIEELCRRLEHLPLAVELAAARTASLTPAQILDRLSQRLDLLKGGRDADPRQRTLRATIDWSHDLLAADDQRLFRRLSVFAGGATLEAVEAVCESDLDTVESLIDKSLVRSGDGRYTMLETLREYAAERLDGSGDRADVLARHARHIKELMAARIPALMGGTDDEVGRALTAEAGNVQAAFDWLVESGDAAGAAALIDTVWWFIGDFISRNRAGLAMCEAVLAMAELTEADRALVRHREGNFAVNLGDADRASRAWADAAELAHRVGDTGREAHAIHNLAISAPDPAEAERLFERYDALAPPKGEREAIQRQWDLVGLKRRVGDVATAAAINADILAWANRVGDYQYMGAAERELAELALHRGDASEALERATRSHDLGASRGHALMTLLAESVRSRAAARLGLHEDSVRSLADAIELTRQGDLDADAEVVAIILFAAVEVFAAIGEDALATKLESVRRRLIAVLPWQLPDVERSHDEWLESTGVAVTAGRDDLDVEGALALIRDWLERGLPDSHATDRG